VRPGLWTAPRGAQCGGRTGRCPRFLAERRPSAEPALGAPKVARPGKRRRSWPKNHRPAARLGRRNASPKADGTMEGSGAMSYPYQSDPIKNPVFRPVYGTRRHNSSYIHFEAKTRSKCL
jgi:hypothetical protein